MRPPVTQIERTRHRTPRAPAWLSRATATLRDLAVETFGGFRADRGFDLAASLSFTTLLLAVPLLATLSLLFAAFFRENVAAVIDVVNSILPYHAARVTENLREFIAESTAISGIGFAVFLVSSVRLVFVVEGIFNAVWGAPRRRAWLPRIAIYTVVLVALGLLLGAIGLGLRRLRRLPVGAALLGSPAAESLLLFAAEFVALTLLYRVLPNAHVLWRAAAAAAGTVSLLLEVLRGLFGVYVRTLSSTNLITGSLALALLSLLSIFFVWVLILAGVELTHAVQAHLGRQRNAGSRRAGRAENAIRMLLRLSGGDRNTFRHLYEGQEADAGEAEKILDRLVARQIVEGDATRGYSLARPLRRITVAQVVEAISPDLFTITAREDDRVAQVLEPLFQRLDWERRILLHATLEDLREK